MSKAILYKGSIYSGVVLSDAGVPVCSNCKSKDSQATSDMHIDGNKWFLNTYKCDCGNGISVNTKRKGSYTNADLKELVL
jgi:hypothetical protein